MVFIKTRRYVFILMVLVIFVLIAGACGSSSHKSRENQDVISDGDNTSDDGDTSSNDGNEGNDGDTDSNHIGSLEYLQKITWESLNGPNGGDMRYVGQDPYHPADLYCSTLRGIYHSGTKGESWSLVEGINPSVNLAYSKNRVFICDNQRGLYYYINETGERDKITEGCKRAFANDKKVFLTGDFDSQKLLIQVADADSATYQWTAISPTANEIESLLSPFRENGELTKYIYVPYLFGDDTQLVILVAVTINDGTDKWITAGLFSSKDQGQNWTPVVLDTPQGLKIQSITQDPLNAKHLMLSYMPCTTEDLPYCAPPDDVLQLGDMVLTSSDGGLTWSPIVQGTLEKPVFGVGDVIYQDPVYYVMHVNDGAPVALSGSDYATAENLSYPYVPGFGQFGASKMFFDLTDGNVVYGYDTSNAVIRSDDKMKTWRLKIEGIVSPMMSNVTVHPTNSDIIATSGVNFYMAQITRDGGKTWQPMEDSAVYADEMIFDPHTSGRMLLVDEVTKFKESTDGGKSWKWIDPEFNSSRIADMHVVTGGSGTMLASVIGEGIVRFGDLEHFNDKADEEKDMGWELLYKSPDYAYDMEPDPTDDKVLYCTYSPKKFEYFAAVYRYTAISEAEYDWSEILKVDKAKGITSVAVDPSDADKIYAGVIGAKGLIYDSQDKGSSWTTTNGALTFATIHALTGDPSDPETAYAAPWGGGLFKTADSGKRWAELKAPTNSIVAVIVDPTDSKHLYIGDRTKPVIYESTDQGGTWTTAASLDTDDYYRVFAMALHQGKLYFSVMDRVSGILALFKSPMSGTTFCREADGTLSELSGELQRVVISFQSDATGLYAVSHLSGVFKLDATGAWASLSENLPNIGFNSILLDGTDIYVTGGSDLDVSLNHRVGDDTVVNEIYKSSDNGTTWTALLKTNPFGSPVKTLIQDSDNKQIFYAATGNGLWVSQDGAKTWQAQSTGLNFKPIGSMWVGGSRIYAGTLGGGVYAGQIGTDATVTWADSTGPFPEIYNMRLRVDPQNGRIIYVTAFPGGVFKSTDGGVTWYEKNFALPSFQVTDPTLQGYYSLEIDPFQPQTIYLGIFGKGVYKSTDGANTWAPQYGVLGRNADIMHMKVTRVKADPNVADTLYLATRDKGVYRSTDGAASWTAINTGLNSLDVLSLQIGPDGTLYAGTSGYGIYLYDTTRNQWLHMGRTIGFGQWWPWERPTYQYSALLFDPQVKGRLYLGHFPSGFFVSEDNGASWKSANAGLGNDGMFSLTMDPANPAVIWAGTYNGVAKSVDRGQSWKMKSQGMPAEQWPFCITIDEQNTDIMYAATKNGHNKGFCDRNEFCGVVLKSIDGGETWSEIMNGLADDLEFYALIMHPDDSDLLFLSTSDGIYGSYDAGTSWHSMSQGLPATENQMRGNVGQNMKLTPDGKYLILGLNAYGVWRADIQSTP